MERRRLPPALLLLLPLTAAACIPGPPPAQKEAQRRAEQAAAAEQARWEEQQAALTRVVSGSWGGVGGALVIRESGLPIWRTHADPSRLSLFPPAGRPARLAHARGAAAVRRRAGADARAQALHLPLLPPGDGLPPGRRRGGGRGWSCPGLLLGLRLPAAPARVCVLALPRGLLPLPLPAAHSSSSLPPNPRAQSATAAAGADAERAVQMLLDGTPRSGSLPVDVTRCGGRLLPQENAGPRPLLRQC